MKEKTDQGVVSVNLTVGGSGALLGLPQVICFVYITFVFAFMHKIYVNFHKNDE